MALVVAVSSPSGQLSRPGTTGKLTARMQATPARTLSSSGGSGSHASSALWLPDAKHCGKDMRGLGTPHMAQLYTPRNFIEVAAGPLQVCMRLQSSAGTTSCSACIPGHHHGAPGAGVPSRMLSPVGPW